jgi:uncharacterized membrane protein
MSSLQWMNNWLAGAGLFVVTFVAALAWWYYHRESRSLASPYSWLLPTLKSLAILLLLLTFLEPVWHQRIQQGEPGSVTFLLDASQSMTIADAPGQIDGRGNRPTENRYQRAVKWLLRNEHFSLEELSQEFDVRVERIEGERTKLLWRSVAGQYSPLPASESAWSPDNWSNFSSLGGAVIQAHTDLSGPGELHDRSPKSAVVLLSDGQSNFGPLPSEAMRQLGNQTAVFSIGYGNSQQQPDLAVRGASYPNRVYKTDVLRGQLMVADHLAKGTAFQASILFQDRPLWQQEFVAQNSGQRTLEFSLPVETLFRKIEAQLSPEVRYSQVPIQLTAKLTCGMPEINSANNLRTMPLSIATQKSRLLIIDQHARWETRYLRNLFERDRAWQVTTLLSTEPSRFAFPTTRDELFQYDLVFLGDLPPRFLTPAQIQQLKEFVELSGGGLVAIAGAGRNLASDDYRLLHACLPVSWVAEDVEKLSRQRLPKQVGMTSLGNKLAALRIDPRGEQESEQLWNSLPAVQYVQTVNVLEGTETLANAIDSLGAQPLMVTRRFGAGRVLFITTDETWRFRYKTSDLIHQRLWQQLARWVMRTPMSVNSEFVSLDSGPILHPVGEEVELRVQLRDSSGRPADGLVPQARLQTQDASDSLLPLRENTELPGTYTAILKELKAGDYRVSVEAAGFSREALDVAVSFTVTEPESLEMQTVTCNEQLLQEWAFTTGGAFVNETDADKLIEQIRPLSGGRFVELDNVLWQTYGWFLTVILLLTLDWWLRKRVGLV